MWGHGAVGQTGTSSVRCHACRSNWVSPSFFNISLLYKVRDYSLGWADSTCFIALHFSSIVTKRHLLCIVIARQRGCLFFAQILPDRVGVPTPLSRCIVVLFVFSRKSINRCSFHSERCPSNAHRSSDTNPPRAVHVLRCWHKACPSLPGPLFCRW